MRKWLAIIALTAMPITAGAFAPNVPDEPLDNGDVDTDYGLVLPHGYAPDLWDDTPTMSVLVCPEQDELCLSDETDRILRLLDLKEKLEAAAAKWRREHLP